LIEQDAKHLQWEAYTADMLGFILSGVARIGGRTLDMPSYSERIYKAEDRGPKESAAQVKQRILDRL